SATRVYELTGLALPPGGFLSFEQVDGDGTAAVPIGNQASPQGGREKRLLSHVRTMYWNSALSGPLPLGQQGVRGMRFEAYQLAYTPALLDDIYPGKWTPAMLAEGKYVLSEAYKAEGLFPASDADEEAWLRSGHAVYFADAAQRFCMPDGYRDARGGLVRVTYHADYHLLVEERKDELDNATRVESFDMRLLVPVRTRDANDNLVEVALDTHGLVTGTALRGKGSEGDDLLGFAPDLTQAQIDAFFAAPEAHASALLGHATTRFVYDYGHVPARAALISRETHHQAALASGVPSSLCLSFEYSDGMGRVAMKKVQAEPGLARTLDGSGQVVIVDTSPGPRWIGSGRTVVNNKGKPVKQYEPYFSASHLYEGAPALVEIGMTPVLYYDPLGRMVRAELQNGTLREESHGAWQQEVRDENDTVLGSAWYAVRTSGPLASVPEENTAAIRAAQHHDTPSVEHLDPLGRPIFSVAHNRFTDENGAVIEQQQATRMVLDVEGRRRAAIDARGNAMLFKYDMGGHVAWQDSPDAGQRWLLGDVMRLPLYSWDANERRFQTKYDVLHRPIERVIRFADSTAHTYERIVYGEGQPDDKQHNLRAQIHRHYDAAGLMTQLDYDFKGNLTRSARTLTLVYATAPDWTDPTLVPLQAIDHVSMSEFDAMSRPVRVDTPDGSATRYVYDRAGHLGSVAASIQGAAETTFVQRIERDEKGQRLEVEYGNGVISTYEYDPAVFRLTRARTQRPSDGALLQDLRYFYDGVGNVTSIVDLAQQSIYFNNQLVEPRQEFTYDALYQLVLAEGREHIGQNLPVDEHDAHRRNLPHPSDGNAVQRYRQRYQYDPAGNLVSMRHTAGSGVFVQQWTRTLTPQATNNRLATVTVGAQAQSFAYDAQGNLAGMPHLAGMTWDFQDRLVRVDLGGGGIAYYVYGADGKRVRKVIERQGGVVEERLYLDGVERYRRSQNGAATLERDTLHVMDGHRRLALVETRTLGDDGSPAQSIRYQHDNHLSSAALELDGQGAIISYEEYHPFGSTSLQSGPSLVEVQRKRYRYTGKERDDET
ncbi:MAG TPA: hypothetical protein VNM90_11060, partial [Haliangium sp.]|nr:hypothetical protein [Haliangium sp.]